MKWYSRRFSEAFLRPINHVERPLVIGIMKQYSKAFAYGLCHCEARSNLVE